MFFSWTSVMTKWAVPNFISGIDAETMATPLSILKEGSAMPEYFDFGNMFLGVMPGSIGEISTLALLVGGVYLLIRKVINWRIPVAFIGTVAILTVIFPRNGYSNVDWMLYNLLSGGGEVALTELVGDLVVARHLGTCLFKGILHILKYGIIKHAVAALGLPAAAYAHSAAIGDVGSALRTLIHTYHLSMYGGKPPMFFYILLSSPYQVKRKICGCR